MLPDPDGGGPLPALATTYTYDARGNLTSLKSPDFSTQSWQYDPTYSQVTRYTDALGRTTDYTLDAVRQRHASHAARRVRLGGRHGLGRFEPPLAESLEPAGYEP